MGVRELRSVSCAQLEALAARVGSALDKWAQDWLPSSHRAGVQTFLAADDAEWPRWTRRVDGWRWHVLGSSGDVDDCVWIAAPEDALLRFGAHLIGAPIHKHDMQVGIGEQLTARAWSALHDDLAKALETAAPTTTDSIPSPLDAIAAPFSGAALVEIECGGVPCMLALSGERIAALRSSTHSRTSHAEGTAMSSLEKALSPLTVNVICTFRPIVVDIGVLGSLRVGDVLILDQTLHEPLYVQNQDGTELCRAFLGKRGDFLALELTRTDHE